MNCKKCGFELSENDKFCTNCGEPVQSGGSEEISAAQTDAASAENEQIPVSQSDMQNEGVYTQPDVQTESIQAQSEAVNIQKEPIQTRPDTGSSEAVQEGAAQDTPQVTQSGVYKSGEAAPNTYQYTPKSEAFEGSQQTQQGVQPDLEKESTQGVFQGTGSGYNYSQQPGAQDMFNQGQQVKKGGAFKFIAGGVAAVIVLIAVFCISNASAMENLFKKTFSSPKDYYKYVAQRHIDKTTERFVKSYDSNIDLAKKYLDTKYDAKFKLEFGDDLIAELEGFARGEDLSWLKSVGINITGSVKSKTVEAYAEYLLNDKDMLSINFWMTPEEFLMELPDLSKEYLYTDLSDNEYMSERIQSAFKDEAYYDALPKGSDIKKVVNKYSAMLLDSASDVKKSTEKLSASGVEQNVTKLEATIKGDDYAKMLQRMTEEAKNDEDVKKIVESLYSTLMVGNSSIPYMYGAQLPATKEEFYKEFQEYLDKISDEISKQDMNDSTIISTIWVNDNGELAGNSIELLDKEDSISKSEYKMPFQGDKFGYELNISDENKILLFINGNGKYASNNLSGQFTVSTDSANMNSYSMYYDEKEDDGDLVELFNIDLKSFDVNAFENAKYNMDFELTIPEQGALASVYTIPDNSKVAVSLKGDDLKAVITVGGKEYFTLTGNSKYTEKAEDIKIPDGDEVNMNNTDDMRSWMKNADWDKLFEKLRKTDLPEKWIDELETSMDILSDY